jgi:hypothetical protein
VYWEKNNAPHQHFSRSMAIVSLHNLLFATGYTGAPAINSRLYQLFEVGGVRDSGYYFSLTRLRESLIRKAGPNFFIFTFDGNNSSVRTSRTFAKARSSPSGTLRCCVSNFASDSLLTSHPKSCNFAERSYCVHPFRSRSLRT